MRGRRTLLTAHWLLGHRNGRHCLLCNGELVIEGQRVLFAAHGFPAGSAVAGDHMDDRNLYLPFHTPDGMSNSNHPIISRGATTTRRRIA